MLLRPWLAGDRFRRNRTRPTETLTETYTYDTTGNRTSITDPRGNTTSLCYDVDYAGAPIATSRGNLTRVISPPAVGSSAVAVTVRSYDAFDNVIQSVRPRGVGYGFGLADTTSCSTDLTGLINVMYATDPAYDATGTLLVSTTSRYTDPDTGPKTAITKFEYGDAAIPANATITGVTISVEWKVSTTASIATLGARAYVSGSPVGTELVNSAEPTTDTTQSFSVPGLTRAQLLNSAFKIQVRATRGNTGTAFTASLDAVSVQVTYTTPGSTTLTTNANGNLVAKGADTFAYDQANRLTSATVAGATESYTYDGDGVRFSRQVGAGPVIRYVSDINTSLPVTIDDGTRKYVYGLGLAYAVAGSSIEVYHTDRLGSVRAITDGSGAVTATYRTDEFGVPTASTGSSGQPFGYTGEPRDATGLSYLRARYYDPSLGRFLSRDPFAGVITIPMSLNRYSYVHNNPTTWVDPSGRLLPIIAFALVVVGSAAVGALTGYTAYAGGLATTNALQGRGLQTTDGWSDEDAVIATVSGGISGAIAGTGVGLVAQVAINAIIGFDATVVSMVVGGRRDASELIAGTALGGLGPKLPAGRGAAGFFRGIVSATTSNTVQNLLNANPTAVHVPISSHGNMSSAKSTVVRGRPGGA